MDRRICRFYAKGKCKYGKDCRFVHAKLKQSAPKPRKRAVICLSGPKDILDKAAVDLLPKESEYTKLFLPVECNGDGNVVELHTKRGWITLKAPNKEEAHLWRTELKKCIAGEAFRPILGMLRDEKKENKAATCMLTEKRVFIYHVETMGIVQMGVSPLQQMIHEMDDEMFMKIRNMRKKDEIEPLQRCKLENSFILCPVESGLYTWCVLEIDSDDVHPSLDFLPFWGKEEEVIDMAPGVGIHVPRREIMIMCDVLREHVLKMPATHSVLFGFEKATPPRYPTRDCSFPGGGIDEGETPRQAAMRECSEEIGWSAPIAPLCAMCNKEECDGCQPFSSTLVGRKGIWKEDVYVFVAEIHDPVLYFISNHR